MRLIDLDALAVEFKKRCRGECCCCTEDYFGSGNDGCGCRVIDDAPTVDAVEVVRCKDCRFHEHEELGMVWCPNVVGSWTAEDGFCSMGERRENET